MTCLSSCIWSHYGFEEVLQLTAGGDRKGQEGVRRDLDLAEFLFGSQCDRCGKVILLCPTLPPAFLTSALVR